MRWDIMTVRFFIYYKIISRKEVGQYEHIRFYYSMSLIETRRSSAIGRFLKKIKKGKVIS
jgi:hypothetical protein